MLIRVVANEVVGEVVLDEVHSRHLTFENVPIGRCSS